MPTTVPDDDLDQRRKALNCCRALDGTDELSGIPAGDAGTSAEALRRQLGSRLRSENPWLAAGPSGAAYAAHFDALAAHGIDIHGEARLVTTLVPPPGPVLDAGCGTGRVAARLAELGYRVVRVDLDESMLAEARRRAPHLDWHLADLATLDIPGRARFDAVVAAGNVFPYLTPGTGDAVLVSLAAQLRPGGLVIAGFTLDPATLPFGDRAGEPVTLAGYDRWCSTAGLSLLHRWAGWDRAPYLAGAYAVSIHRRDS